MHKTHVWGRAEQVLAKSQNLCQNRRTGLKLSANRENSAFSIKSAENALFGPCGASFGKMSLYGTTDVKIVVLASNHREIGKTVRFL